MPKIVDIKNGFVRPITVHLNMDTWEIVKTELNKGRGKKTLRDIINELIKKGGGGGK